MVSYSRLGMTETRTFPFLLRMPSPSPFPAAPQPRFPLRLPPKADSSISRSPKSGSRHSSSCAMHHRAPLKNLSAVRYEQGNRNRARNTGTPSEKYSRSFRFADSLMRYEAHMLLSRVNRFPHRLHFLLPSKSFHKPPHPHSGHRILMIQSYQVWSELFTYYHKLYVISALRNRCRPIPREGARAVGVAREREAGRTRVSD